MHTFCRFAWSAAFGKIICLLAKVTLPSKSGAFPWRMFPGTLVTHVFCLTVGRPLWLFRWRFVMCSRFWHHGWMTVWQYTQVYTSFIKQQYGGAGGARTDVILSVMHYGRPHRTNTDYYSNKSLTVVLVIVLHPFSKWNARRCNIVFVAVLHWRVFSLSTNLRQYRSTYDIGRKGLQVEQNHYHYHQTNALLVPPPCEHPDAIRISTSFFTATDNTAYLAL